MMTQRRQIDDDNVTWIWTPLDRRRCCRLNLDCVSNSIVEELGWISDSINEDLDWIFGFVDDDLDWISNSVNDDLD
ncbi:hypothetical protein ACLB2K_059888 [Fragaria x ananassa]